MARRVAPAPLKAEELYTVAEVAAYLKCCTATVYRLAGAKTLASVRVGTSLRIPQSAVLGYLNSPPVPAKRGPKGGAVASQDPAHLVDKSVWESTDAAMRRRKGLPRPSLTAH